MLARGHGDGLYSVYEYRQWGGRATFLIRQVSSRTYLADRMGLVPVPTTSRSPFLRLLDYNLKQSNGLDYAINSSARCNHADDK